MRKIPRLRWWIVSLIFLASVLNYLDRQTLSLLAPTIQKDLKLGDADYAWVVNIFLVAYTFSYVFSGRLIDRIGVRAGFALFVGWWSLANVLTGAARSLASLALCRFLLGLGEAGNWTAGPKAVREWFPAGERGLALGTYTLGATIGATLAPLLVIGLAARYGWQMAFAVTGVAGLFWLGPWLWLYRRPLHHPRITAAELAVIDPVAPEAPSPPVTWKAVLRRREVWVLMLLRLITDPVWYFYQFWFAKYLYDTRGVSQSALSVTWVIFLAADLGTLGGGGLSGWLVKRGRTAPGSRTLIMAAAAAVMPLSALVPALPGTSWVLAIAMVVVCGQMAWLINLSTLVVDLIPAPMLATAFGVIAAGSTIGGISMNWGVARLVRNYSYTPAFVALALLHPLGLLVLWRFRGFRSVNGFTSDAIVSARS